MWKVVRVYDLRGWDFGETAANLIGLLKLYNFLIHSDQLELVYNNEFLHKERVGLATARWCGL